jgi:hypothetical protein
MRVDRLFEGRLKGSDHHFKDAFKSTTLIHVYRVLMNVGRSHIEGIAVSSPENWCGVCFKGPFRTQANPHLDREDDHNMHLNIYTY